MLLLNVEDEKSMRPKTTLYIFILKPMSRGSGMPSSITRLNVLVEE